MEAPICRGCYFKDTLEEIGDRLGSKDFFGVRRDTFYIIDLLNVYGCYHSEDTRKSCQKKVGHLIALSERNIRREIPQDHLIEQAQLLQITDELRRRQKAFEEKLNRDIAILCNIVCKLGAHDSLFKSTDEERDLINRYDWFTEEKVPETHGDKCRCDACTTDKLYEDSAAGKLRAGPPCPTCKTPMGRTSDASTTFNGVEELYGRVMCDRCASDFRICSKCGWYMVETLGPLGIRHFHCKRCDFAAEINRGDRPDSST